MAHRKTFPNRRRGPQTQQRRPQGRDRSDARERNIAPSHLVVGRNAVSELLQHRADSIKRVLYAAGERDARLLSALDQARALGLELSELTPQALSAMLQTTSHQGLAAELKSRTFYDLKWLLARSEEDSESLVLLLDSINDPHNFGAILRVAECFGAAAVVISPNRGCGITPAVTKTSAGASELVPIVQVSNLSEAQRRLSKAGFSAIAADVDSQAVPLTNFTFPSKTLLMLGSEGEGLQPLLKREAEYVLKIPLFGKIQSLNVAQAAAVLLYAARRR